MNWISVKDDLPEPWEYVLVAGDKEGDEPCPISIARYYGMWEMLSNECQCNAVVKGDLSWGMYADEITNWMPLPPFTDTQEEKSE